MDSFNKEKVVRTTLVIFWIFGLVALTSWLVGVAALSHLLVWGAPFLPALPILGLFWLRPKEELAGWMLFTIWLGMTSVSGVGLLGTVVSGIIVLLAVGGFLKTPWLLVIAWFGHIIWDFVPRERPALYQDMPLACIIFDGLIGAYIVWRIWSWRQSAKSPAEPANISLSTHTN